MHTDMNIPRLLYEQLRRDWLLLTSDDRNEIIEKIIASKDKETIERLWKEHWLLLTPDQRKKVWQAMLPESAQPVQLDESMQGFKREHDPLKTVIIMMKFSGGDPNKDDKLKTLFNTIKHELDKYGLGAVRTDEKNYSKTDYIWDNVQIYLDGCDYGIAVLENLYLDEMNPNVALEYGYMLAKSKRLLLLKEKSFENIRADILGKIWKEFELDKSKSIKKAIQAWMVDLGLAKK